MLEDLQKREEETEDILGELDKIMEEKLGSLNEMQAAMTKFGESLEKEKKLTQTIRQLRKS